MATSKSEKTALVTGGNRGLGFATAKKLAAAGINVVITSRDRAQGEAAAAAIKAGKADARVSCLELDLTSFSSARQCAADFLKLGLPLDILVNNAGLMVQEEKVRITKEGFELTLATNHLGHFLLTHLLLPLLVKSAGSRIVNVSSSMHMSHIGKGKPVDFDYDNLRGEKYFDAIAFYRNSKLANLWFTYELHRRFFDKGIASNAVCPGFVPATIAENQKTTWNRILFKYILPLMPFARTVDQGAGNTFFAATDPGLNGMSGKFIKDRLIEPSSDESNDEQKAKKLWEKSCEWCGIKEFGRP